MVQPLIILTCMRSYSSLVSTMLGQHPQMYGLPELNLFVAEKVRGMVTVFSAIRPNSLNGIHRTIAEIEFGGQNAGGIEMARDWLNKRQNWTTKRLFRHFIDALAPRICIEKSPSTVLNESFMKRMYRQFPDAHYLHLVRHPRATCKSIHQIVTQTDEITGRRRGEQVEPEKLWLKTNGNILRFMADLPPGQGMVIQGEALLGDPDNYLAQICQWLGIRDDAQALDAMKHPEQSPYARLGPPNAPFGNDPNFLRNPYYKPREIPAVFLEGPLEWVRDPHSHFSQETVLVARQLGYQ